MKRLLRALRLCAFSASLVCLVVAAGLLALEQSGWLARRIQRELSRRLGAQVTLEGADLRWFAGAVELQGLGFETPGGGLFLERARAVFGRGPRGARLRRIDIDGGRAMLSQELVDRLRRLAASDTAGPPPTAGMPTLVIRGLQVDYSHPDWGDIPIGRVDVLAREDLGGKPIIEGRIVPTLAVRATEAGAPLPEIYLGGHEVDEGLLEIHGSTEGIPVNVDALPEGTGLEVFRAYAPRGELALTGQVFVSLDGSTNPSGTMRAALTRGSILPTTTEAPFEDLRVELFARCSPVPGGRLLDPNSWQSTASVAATWHDSPISGWALFGRNAGPGLSARGWLKAVDFPLSREALGGLGIDANIGLRHTWDALALRGVGDVYVGVRTPDQGEQRKPEFTVELVAKGRAGMTYVGWPTHKHPSPQGVPLPVDQLSGRALIAWGANRPTPFRLGFWNVDGTHSGARRPTQRAHADGLIVSPTEQGGYARFDLRYGGEDLAADENLRVALQGLEGTDFIWPMFQPGGGRCSFEAHMIRPQGTLPPASRFDFDLAELTGAFELLPARLEDVHGHLELVFDRRLAFGAGFDVTARTPTSERVSVTGRVQEDATLPRPSDGGSDRTLRDIRASAEGVALRGVDRDAVAETLPGVGAALDSAGAVGKVDVGYRTTKPRPGGPTLQTLEVTPGMAEASPENFKVRTTGLRGRILVQAVEPGEASEEADRAPRVTTRLQPLVGDWSGNTKVAVQAELSGKEESRLQLFGTGLDVSNRVLAGAFREAFTPESTRSGVDLAALAIDGRVDFTAELGLAEAPAAERPGKVTSSYRIFLRDNDLETGTEVRFGLGGLHGSLVQRGNSLHGEGITGRLGTTPLTLRTADFSVEDDGRYQFETRLEARDLPLDREHMRHFLDEPTLEALVGGLGWRGRVDIDDATLRLTGSPDDPGGRVDFSGHATPTDMYIDIGLPLSITQASVDIESLVLEGGHVRAWATAEHLDGKIADRELTDAHMTLTYIEPHLSVLDLDGGFDRGRLRNLATRGSSGPAFSIDLQDPFPFGVAVRLVDVDVARVLRGLFESDFASKGRLSAELRLFGSLDRITGIRGDGLLRLDESTLWSIPVMRDLFSQLGFDNTAVFDSMRTRFRIANGKVHMREMQVESPLLSLVGEGTLDFDGRLHHDLQVRYGLVDKLGPLTRLVYFIQNNLLSVAIRGDMSRPQVVLQGVLSFFQRLKHAGRDLPLPGFSPLPERF